jgi:hypothetical protein
MSAPAAPTNALSMNKGNGSCEIQWSASVNAVSYNVYLATSLTGTYRKANLKPILGTVTRLPNLKFGLTVFFKVTAVNAAGEYGSGRRHVFGRHRHLAVHWLNRRRDTGRRNLHRASRPSTGVV